MEPPQERPSVSHERLIGGFTPDGRLAIYRSPKTGGYRTLTALRPSPLSSSAASSKQSIVRREAAIQNKLVDHASVADNGRSGGVEQLYAAERVAEKQYSDEAQDLLVPGGKLHGPVEMLASKSTPLQSIDGPSSWTNKARLAGHQNGFSRDQSLLVSNEYSTKTPDLGNEALEQHCLHTSDATATQTGLQEYSELTAVTDIERKDGGFGRILQVPTGAFPGTGFLFKQPCGTAKRETTVLEIDKLEPFNPQRRKDAIDCNLDSRKQSSGHGNAGTRLARQDNISVGEALAQESKKYVPYFPEPNSPEPWHRKAEPEIKTSRIHQILEEGTNEPAGLGITVQPLCLWRGRATRSAPSTECSMAARAATLSPLEGMFNLSSPFCPSEIHSDSIAEGEATADEHATGSPYRVGLPWDPSVVQPWQKTNPPTRHAQSLMSSGRSSNTQISAATLHVWTRKRRDFG